MTYTTRLDSDDERNNKGQWAPGVSGNPSGRPPKAKEPPKGLGEEIAVILGKPVTVMEKGEKQEISMAAAMVSKAVQGALNGPPKDLLWLLEKFEKFGAFDVLKGQAEANENEADVFTETHRRILEAIEREIDLDGNDEGEEEPGEAGPDELH